MSTHGLLRKLLRTTATWLKLFPPPLPPTTLSSLPDDLIAEILVRLPHRTLVELSGVCKSWKTLISSPQFAREQFQRSIADPNPNQLLAYHNLGDLDSRIRICALRTLFLNPVSGPNIKLFSFEFPDVVSVVGSCNGLLCLHAPSLNSFRLWNPCNRLASKWLKTEDKEGHLVACHGFGYDHVHDKYKLLLVVVNKSHEYVTMVCIFGPNTCTTTIQDFPFSPPPPYSGRFVNGALNWITKDQDQWVIVSFNLAKETFGQVSLPNVNNDSICFEPVLQVFKNCLCLCFLDKESHKWVVYSMKEFKVEQSWTKLTMISHFPYPREWSPLQLFYTSEDYALATSLMDFRFPLYYSSDRKSYIVKFGKERLSTFYVYHESLVSPSHYDLQSSLYGQRVD